MYVGFIGNFIRVHMVCMELLLIMNSISLKKAKGKRDGGEAQNLGY